jgi:hypothetical protein
LTPPQRGKASLAFCQRDKLARRETFTAFPAQVRAERLRWQTAYDHPDSTSGLVAWLDFLAGVRLPNGAAPGIA